MTMLGQDELVHHMGVGHLGEVRQGPDGQLYQWVQGIDGLGNPIGFWKALRRVANTVRSVARQAMPIVQHIAPLVPGGAAALRVATPVLQRAGVAGTGALYQAPDGSVYAGEPTAALQGIAYDGGVAGMGIGQLGEVRQGTDRQLYQWAEGVDGLGNPIGIWKRLRRVAQNVQRVARQAMPIVQQIAPLVPGGAAALRVATPVLQRAGVAGDPGVGALYQAPDGSLYEGEAAPGEVAAMADDLAQAYPNAAPARESEVELNGFAQSDLPQPVDQEGEELEGLEGYLWEDPALRGLEAYVPQQPVTTPHFVPPSQPPEMWKPLW